MDIRGILSQMTLREKVEFCQGKNKWETTGVPRLGIPPVWVSDGPIGVRREISAEDNGTGFNETHPAVCFPAMAGITASFDPELAYETGEDLALAARELDVDVLLGPAANIKRSPLCGRNFEYMSEDPFLAGKIAAAYIRGVQSKGVGTSLKHFAVNSQETRRFTVNELVQERALREIYLPAFEEAVKEADPWTIMCSYNKVNGCYSSQNKWLLTDLLRDEWGFKGLVMSDWWAVHDHAASVSSGLSLEMPRKADYEDDYLYKAVEDGRVTMEELDREVLRLLRLTELCLEGRNQPKEEYDACQQHHQSRRIAREAMVLLKNDGGLLPIEGKKTAFIGEFAAAPRYQGGGSSHINATEVLSALDAVRSVSAVTYAQGFNANEDTMSAEQLNEAVKVAQAADVAVLFLGLPDAYESEGYDRTHMHLPACQEKLLEEVWKVQKNIVVVLHNGAPVEMPWVDKVPAILEAYLGGQAAGGAVVDLLFGAVSPCGKLAETFPIQLEDNPSYLNFPGYRDSVGYAEGIWVGYRYYDRKNMKVLFPFGHGLTYTTFRYDDLKLSADSFRAGETLTASVKVTNTGKFCAKEIVQFYVAPKSSKVQRPVRELKGIAKVLLQPGETKEVSVELGDRSFACWMEENNGWYIEPGTYAIEAAASSRDIRLAGEVAVEGHVLPLTVTTDTFIKDVLTIPAAKQILLDTVGEDKLPALENWPGEFGVKHVIQLFTNGKVEDDAVNDIIRAMNDVQK